MTGWGGSHHTFFYKQAGTDLNFDWRGRFKPGASRRTNHSGPMQHSLEELTESLINEATQYEKIDQKDIPKLMQQQLKILTIAQTIDERTNSKLGSFMWGEFELKNHTNWPDRIRNLLHEFNNTSKHWSQKNPLHIWLYFFDRVICTQNTTNQDLA